MALKMCKFAPEIINTGKNTMNEIPKCPDCSHEFDSVEDAAEVDDVARDSNGAEGQRLFDGYQAWNKSQKHPSHRES